MAGESSDTGRFPDDHELLREALQRMLGDVQSEPLKLHELAALFRVPSKTAAGILRALERRGRAERVGRRWRVCIANLPPAYHFSAGYCLPRD